MRGGGIFVLVGACASTLMAATPLELAAQAEKVGDWQEALGDYQAAYASSGDDKLLKSIGNCQAHLKRWRDASESFRRYLSKHPEEKALAAYEARLQASLEKRPFEGAAAATSGVD